jgi:short-subunit dehydrogenase
MDEPDESALERAETRMSADFEQTYGPWAIVTGASSGIGEAFAHAVARRGLQPMLVARRRSELARVARDVEAMTGIEPATLVADLASLDFVDRVCEACESRDVGLVVSNAGYNPPGDFEERSREELCAVLDINCRAPLLLAEAFVPRLRARGRGGFLITGSVEGFHGVPHSSVYAASKNFVQAFGEGLWGELAGEGIDVLVLAPGATDTPLIRSRNMQDLPGIMTAESVAEFGLDHLGQGPTAIPGETNQQMVATFAAMPRSEAVAAMGQAMAAASAQAAGGS